MDIKNGGEWKHWDDINHDSQWRLTQFELVELIKEINKRWKREQPIDLPPNSLRRVKGEMVKTAFIQSYGTLNMWKLVVLLSIKTFKEICHVIFGTWNNTLGSTTVYHLQKVVTNYRLLNGKAVVIDYWVNIF